MIARPSWSDAINGEKSKSCARTARFRKCGLNETLKRLNSKSIRQYNKSFQDLNNFDIKGDILILFSII